MKKLYLIVSVVLCAILFTFVLGACSGSNTHKVTFDLNYEGAPAATVVEVEDNTFVQEPETPVRTNYEFTGWYTDSACQTIADLERSVTADMTVYAGWKRTQISVTFDLNYTGGGTYGEVQSIAIGGTPTRPANPDRDGYSFLDWYTVSDSSAQTDETRYNFTALSEDTVLYAGWEELGENTATVTLMWNYDGAPGEGVYSEQAANIGSTITMPVLQRDSADNISYSLKGWRDAEGSEYAVGDVLTVEGDVTLYAVWTVINTYEAELTDMSYFQGAGWSWNRVGTTAISYDKNNVGGSNAGYNAYVANMNAKGAFLYFEIDSDRAVSGLTLKLRLSIECSYFSEMELWPEIFAVSTASSYDGERTYIDYERIRIEGVIGKDVAEFENYLITADLDLIEGTNYIFVETAASFAEAGYPELAGQMGAMSAIAPVMDALIVEHTEGEASLSWTPRVCNLWNYGYDEAEYPCSCDRH